MSCLLYKMHSCMQVHVLFVSCGHEPVLARIAQRAARLLTPHSLWHNAALAPLLPKVAPVQAPGLQQALRVDGGSLGQAASGTFLALSCIIINRSCSLIGVQIQSTCMRHVHVRKCLQELPIGAETLRCRCAAAACGGSEEEGAGAAGGRPGPHQPGAMPGPLPGGASDCHTLDAGQRLPRHHAEGASSRGCGSLGDCLHGSPRFGTLTDEGPLTQADGPA